jgi:hypothetical protein
MNLPPNPQTVRVVHPTLPDGYLINAEDFQIGVHERWEGFDGELSRTGFDGELSRTEPKKKATKKKPDEPPETAPPTLLPADQTTEATEADA